MKAKYASTCVACNKEVKIGEEIFYDSENHNSVGKAIVCSDLECYKKQGGSTIKFDTKSSGYKYTPLTIEQMEERMNAIKDKAYPKALEVVKELMKMEEFKNLDPAEALVAVESFTRTFGAPYTR